MQLYEVELLQGEQSGKQLVLWLMNEGLSSIGLVTCASLRATQHYQTWCALLKEAHLNIVEAIVKSNPVDTAIDEIAKTFRQHQVHCVIGIGGGSVLDSAKGISFLDEQHPNIMAFRTQPKMNRRYPLVLVPTSVGTGSEVSQTMVITDHLDGKKKRIIHEAIRSDLIVLDPIYPMSLPIAMLKSSAIDALAHSIEGISNASFLQTNDEEIKRAAFHAIKRILTYLPIALHDPLDVTSREQLQWASFYGGYCMRKDLNACHVLAGALHQHCPSMGHGTAVGILLGEVLALNREVCEEVYANVEREVFHQEGTSKALSFHFLNRIQRFLQDIQFPILRHYVTGNTEGLLRLMSARLAQANRLNARQLGIQEVERIIAHCLLE